MADNAFWGGVAKFLIAAGEVGEKIVNAVTQQGKKGLENLAKTALCANNGELLEQELSLEMKKPGKIAELEKAIRVREDTDPSQKLTKDEVFEKTFGYMMEEAGCISKPAGDTNFDNEL